MAQWIRIHLAMKGTQVWFLVQEDFTCRGATKPMCCNDWACGPQTLKPACLEPAFHNKSSHGEAGTQQLERSPCSLQLETSRGSNEGQAQPKINKIILKKRNYRKKYIWKKNSSTSKSLPCPGRAIRNGGALQFMYYFCSILGFMSDLSLYYPTQGTPPSPRLPPQKRVKVNKLAWPHHPLGHIRTTDKSLDLSNRGIIRIVTPHSIVMKSL